MEEHQVNDTTDSESSDDISILNHIKQCCLQARVLTSNQDFNIFEYLKKKYSNDKSMLETCISVMAAPNNQESVERAFSALRILLNHLRNNLSSESIQNLLICNLNSSLLPKLNYESMI